MITRTLRLARADRERIDTLSADLWHEVFMSLDCEPGVDTDDAGAIATQVSALLRKRLEEILSVA